MKSRKKLLQSSRLYVIIDKNTSGKKPVKLLCEKLKGADIVQLRDKSCDKESVLRNAYLLKEAFLDSNTLFIINDYLDIAKIVDCDGLHIGQDDIPIEIARRVLGKGKIIGISCHSLMQALDAQDRGADYIGFGPVFSTPTKPGSRAIGLASVKKLKKRLRIPFFAIGDVNLNNISNVMTAGARRAAVCRAVIRAKNIPSAVKDFNKILH